MKLIIGLRNPGAQYKKTRHNIGARIVEALRRDWKLDKWKNAPTMEAEIVDGIVNDEIVTLALPTTMMNNSGRAAAPLADRYTLNPDDLVVVHDDADITLGAVRLEHGRGAAGHHGVESVIKALENNDFWRLRAGIRTPERDASDLEQFALKPFRPGEDQAVDTMIDTAVKELTAWIAR